jgi:hypothetical protein
MPADPTIAQFVLYAERTVVLGDRSRASRGDIGVRTSAGPSVGTQLALGAHDETADLFAPSTTVGRRAKVGDVQTASLQNEGADSLGAVSAFPAATMPPLPLALASSGGSDVQVPPHQVRSLSPGTYGALTLANSSTVLLATGKYSFSTVTLGEHSELVGNPGGVDVTIVRSLAMSPSTQIHPRGKDKRAKDFTIAIAGDDGPDASSPVVRIGPHSRLQALLAAPHGTVAIADSVEVKGAVAGFDIRAGAHDDFILEDGFPVSAPGQQGSQQLQGYVKASMSLAPLIGPVPQGEILNVAVGLPFRDPNGLAAFLRQVSDPTSPLYRHYLTPAQFVATYGPTTEDYQALTAFAQANGLSVTQAFSNNALLRVSGPAGAIERAFYVNFNNYARPDTSSFYALDRDPSLDLTIPVLRISGLDNYVLGTPSAGSGPLGSFQGNDFRNAYLGAASVCSSLTGAGQSIALFELDTYNPADITLYEAQAGLPTVALNPVAIISATGGGGPSPVSNANTRLEVAGDIETALSMAPGATITPFLAPGIGGTDPTNAILNAIATQTPLSFQISSSWNTDADENTGQALSQLAAQGQSLFQSSGDFGAYGINPPGGLKNLDYSYATVVGGTVLTMNGAGASYKSETTWTGSGGGFLQYPPIPLFNLPILDVPIPDYQKPVINSSNGGSGQFRNVPDVSAVATGMVCVVGGVAVGCAGTSFATPLWAAFVALMNQRGQINASPQVGFINPALYAVAGTGLYGNAFNDIKDGSTNSNNGSVTGFPAVTGYDLATGLGSPQCGLIPALVGGPGGGGGGNNVNVSATETQFGPDVCVNGTGFVPGGVVRSEYFGIPGRVAPLPGGGFAATVKPDGSFNLGVDTTNEGRLVTCNAAELGNTVTVTVSETDSNGNIIGTGNGTMPAAYWCGGAGVSTNFHGGCP